MIGINKNFKKNKPSNKKIFFLDYFLNSKSNQTKGFAMLYTIILITIISTLSFGAASLSFKQRQLSRLAIDSGNALYLADSGLECALAYYYEGFNLNSYVLPNTIECLSPFLNQVGGPEILPLDSFGSNLYEFPPFYDMSNPCYEIEVDVDTSVTPNITTGIRSRGYNICDPNDSRRVERTLSVIFE